MMGGQGIVALGALLGLLAAVGLVVAIVRGGRERRKPLFVALIVTLVLTTVAGVAWARIGAHIESGAPAPVDANLTIFAQGLDCSRDTGDCGLPNALYAVRADAGSVRWETVQSKPAYIVGSSPLFHDGIVYTYIYPGPSANKSWMTDYLLTAWRGRDGVQLWHTRVTGTSTEPPPTYLAGDRLAVLDDSGDGSAAAPSWSLTLLRASDGSQVGKTVLPARIFPTVVDNTVYQCLPDDTVIAMRLSDGAMEWRSSVAGAAAQTYPGCFVKETGGVVFVSMLAGSDNGAGQTGQLLALSATNGQTLWRYATSTPEPFAIGDGLVVLGEGSRFNPTSLVALRISDGTVAWRHTGFPPRSAFQGYFQNRTVVIGGGLALVGGGGPTLWALRTDNGSVAWHITEDHRNLQAIDVVNSTVFVSSTFVGSGIRYDFVFSLFSDTNTYFSALRASDGAQYWRTPLGAGGDVVMGGA